jgi:protocatechuate 3,4-dioxygenase beta subunit
MGNAVLDWQPYYLPPTYDLGIDFTGGHQLPYYIIGQCVDNVGAPVAGATVELWRAADEMLIQTQLSRADGTYAFGVTDTVTPYFVVAWRAAPAIGGITVRNLVGAAA